MKIINRIKTSVLFTLAAVAILAIVSCSDDNNEGSNVPEVEENFVGAAVGNFSAEEWYVGGELGTTMNVTAGCYEDETPAVTEMGLTDAFNRGEQFFERNVTEFQAPFNGLGPAYESLALTAILDMDMESVSHSIPQNGATDICLLFITLLMVTTAMTAHT